MATTASATEGGIIEQPARTLAEIRSDLMKLEHEMSHHFMYAKWRKNQKQTEEIAEAANDMHHAACKLSIFVYPIWPR